MAVTASLQCSCGVSAFGFFGNQEEATEEEIYEYTHPWGDGQDYGVDVSSPIHSQKISTNYPWLPHNVDPENNPTPPEYQHMPIQIMGDKQSAYEEMIAGCEKFYGRRGGACKSTERDRVAMNLRQPKSMQNYTNVGFKKIKTPESVFKIIREFWENNKEGYDRSPEKWNAGNTYTNHWDSPTYMVSVEDTKLRGGGQRIKSKIWNLAKDTLQEWTGEELTPCSLYGIRVYTEGAVLATHVDRLPLVSSAIVNVAQDVDEPWPIEVYGHDGKAYNITMEPGDMVLYESHSVLHGRPFPLKGRYYANIFIHFEPVGHSLRHNSKMDPTLADVNEEYRKSLANGKGGHENHDNDGLPYYVIDGTEEAANWRRQHGKSWKPSKNVKATTGSTSAHAAANQGDVDTLKEIIKTSKAEIHKTDQNGWAPIHEGARGGHTEVLQLLVESGVDINKRTNGGKGPSPLYLAIQSNGKNHRSVRYLESVGAKNIEPEL